MEENEKKQEQAQEAPTGGYQPNFRPQPGRSPRPRIHQPRPYTNTGSGSQYKTQQGEEGGFRPEGFGTALQGTAQQRPAYRPRNTYNNEGGYGRPQQNNAYGRPQQGGYGRPQRQGGYGRPQGEGGRRPPRGRAVTAVHSRAVTAARSKAVTVVHSRAVTVVRSRASANTPQATIQMRSTALRSA